MSKYILALDQGTSSSRAILFNKQGKIIAIEQEEFPQLYPKPGWVEQNPFDIWNSQLTVMQKVVINAKTTFHEVAAIGITNQRETTIIWDKNTGEPVYNAIVWQDKRTAAICDEIKKDDIAEYIAETTGLIIDSYFSATKIKWILDNVDGVREKADNGDLLFGTVDSWLIWKLSNGTAHVTDFTNASRTMLFNIKSLEWDKNILCHLNIPLSILPKPMGSMGTVAYADIDYTAGVTIPIAGIAGDQQAALFGQLGFKPGISKNTYGTGCFILTHTGTKKVKSEHGLLTTLTCDTKANNPQYALEGSVFIAGAAIKWLRDTMGIINTAAETQEISQTLDENDGVYVVPAFTGLGAPYWDQYSRGAIFGLTLGTTDKHIVKATLESLAYQSKDVLDIMVKDAGVNITKLCVDGGASANDYLMQFQADILCTNIERPCNIESTALGAAFLAGLAVGFWKDISELEKLRTVNNEFKPKMDAIKAEKLYKGWQKAVDRSLRWEK